MINRELLYRRLSLLLKCMAISIGILVAVLFKIQIIDHEELSEKALRQNNMVITSNTVRGNILDRNGIPFTVGKEVTYLKIYPRLVGERIDVLNTIKNLTGRDGEDLERAFSANPQDLEIPIVNKDEDLVEEVLSGIYNGLYIYTTYERYDENSLARHIVGYIQRDGSPIMGIEKNFHDFLDSGSKSYIYGFKDVNDNPIVGAGYTYRESDSIYHDVQLSIDYNIQGILERALDEAGGRNGAIVVDIANGEILAAASRPNYRQYDIGGSIEPDCFWAVPFKAFPLGSVFKTVVAAAALEQGGYTRDDVFYCDGGIDINGTFYSCHKKTGGLGQLTLQEAFARSCNDTFIKIAKELGGHKVIELAREFGFGSSLDIGLSNDEGGLPDKHKFSGAGIGNLALGQGDVMVTPLQAVDMMTTIANGGVRKPLKLVKKIISSDGTDIEWHSEYNQYRVISEETARELQEWLIHAAKHGTGKRAYDDEFGGSGGKTGTPQVSYDAQAEHYGWFAGFFPAAEPKYAMVILSREEGEGGTTAAPIFREIARGIWEYSGNLQHRE